MKDLIRVGSSNVIFTILSIVITLFLPFYLSIEDYGYWQVFYMYSAFAGLAMLGFNDGIHLKYSGIEKSKLKLLPIKGYLIFNSLFSLLFVLLVLIFILNSQMESIRKLIFILLGFQVVIFNLNSLFSHIYLISEQFKRFSINKYSQRLLFVTGLFVLLIFFNLNVIEIILISILSGVCIFISNFYTNFQYVNNGNVSLTKSEVSSNFKRGLPLTIAAIISMLLIMYPRILIDYFMDIEYFSTYSLANSFLSLVLTLILSLSIVLYPKLKKLDAAQVKTSLNKITMIVSPIIVYSLMSYFVMYMLIKTILNDYIGMINFFHFMIPMVYFQAMFNIIVVNVFKVFNLERKLLIINISGLIINILVTTMCFFIFESIESIALTSSLTYMLFYIVIFIYITKKINWNFDKFSFTLDIITIIIFVAVIEYQTIVHAFFTTFILLIVYSTLIFIKNKDSYKKWRKSK